MILQCTVKTATDNALCASPNGANATLYKCISMHCKNIQVKPSFGIIHQLDNSKLGWTQQWMTLTCCQDHILTENIWFVWSETLYSGDERRCYLCGTNNRTKSKLTQLLCNLITSFTQMSSSVPITSLNKQCAPTQLWHPNRLHSGFWTVGSVSS